MNRTAAELRQRAEAVLQEKYGNSSALPKPGASLPPLHTVPADQEELETINGDLRMARFELETALEKYTDLYEFALFGCFTLDDHGTISAANRAGAMLAGIERSRLLGRSFTQLVVAEQRQQFLAFLNNVFGQQEKQSCDVELSTKQGTSLPVRIDGETFGSGQECHIAVIDMSRESHNDRPPGEDYQEREDSDHSTYQHHDCT
jgi:PAS domain S-box-containing protein